LNIADFTSAYTPFLRHLHLFFRTQDRWREVMPLLANFRTPRLRSLGLTDLAWHSLSPDQRSAFLRRFDLIVSLRLNLFSRNITNDVTTIISSLPHLRTLFLESSVRFPTSPGPLPVSPEFRLPERLSTLHLKDCYQNYRLFLEWLSSIPEQLSVHNLHLTMSSPQPQDFDTVNMFMKALGPSLEVFSCNSTSMFISSAPKVELC
jgi:hypothetical protein